MPRWLGRGRVCLPLPCRNAHRLFHQTPQATCGFCLPQQPPSPRCCRGTLVRAGSGGPAGGGGAASNVSSCCRRPLPHSCQNALEEIHSHLPEQGSPRRDVTLRCRTMAPRLRTSRHVLTPPSQPPRHRPRGSARLSHPWVCPRPGGLFAGSEWCEVCYSLGFDFETSF